MQDQLPSALEIRAHLDEIRASGRFAQCGRLVTLLGFLVEECLAGRQRGLKEIVIGHAVYRRDPPYDPRIDSTVRVEARRLRLRLDAYYADEGRKTTVRILLSPGSYVPAFETRSVPDPAPAEPEAPEPAGQSIFVPGAGAAIAVMPFQVLSDGAGDEAFADGLADELIYRLQSAPGLRVASPSASFQYKGRPYLLSEAAERLGVVAFVQGTVLHAAHLTRVTIEIVDPEGFCVWAERFDTADPPSVALQERIATSALGRLRFDSSGMKAARVAPGGGALRALATVLRGRQLIDRQTPAALAEALGHFEGVAAAARDYARGHAGIADCRLDLWRLGLADAAGAAAAVEAATRRALEIDAGSIEGRVAECAGRGFLGGALDLARDAMAEEARRQASDPRCLRLLALMALAAGQPEHAALLAAEARDLDAFSVHQHVVEALVLFHARRHDALLALEATHLEALHHQLLALALRGDAPAVRARLPLLERAAPAFPHLRCAAAELGALLGEPLPDLDAAPPHGMAPTAFARATAALAGGNRPMAAAFLAQAVRAREFPALLWRTDPRSASLAAPRLGPIAA